MQPLLTVNSFIDDENGYKTIIFISFVKIKSKSGRILVINTIILGYFAQFKMSTGMSIVCINGRMLYWT